MALVKEDFYKIKMVTCVSFRDVGGPVLVGVVGGESAEIDSRGNLRFFGGAATGSVLCGDSGRVQGLSHWSSLMACLSQRFFALPFDGSERGLSQNEATWARAERFFEG